MLTQILPKNVLTDFITIIHDIRENLGFQQFCCEEGRKRVVKNYAHNQFMTAAVGYQTPNHPPVPSSAPNVSLPAFKRPYDVRNCPKQI